MVLEEWPRPLREWVTARHPEAVTSDALEKALADEIEAGNLSRSKFNQICTRKGVTKPTKGKTVPKPPEKKTAPAPKPAPSPVQRKFARLDPVAPSARLSSKTSPVLTKSGQPLVYDGRPVMTTSDRQKATIGAYGRLLATKLGLKSRPLSDYERALLAEAADKGEFCGDVGGIYYDRDHPCPASMAKAVLDDSVSGGIEISPYYFDDAIITYPLLHGQLAPYVNMVDVPRGRRVKGGVINNPTMTWGTAEGTAITPFNTSALVGPLDTIIYPLTGAIEVGLDFEEDSSVNIGETMVELFGSRTANELDKVIAVGDGVTQPLGIFNTSGTSVVNSDNGVGGPVAIADLEKMIAAVPPQYRNDKSLRLRWLLSDTQYNRICSIQVNSADERRVFGTNNHGEYNLMNYPVSIGTTWPINQGALVAFAKFRMYRRLGLETRVETGGKQLALNNTKLVVCRARFGGRVVDGAAVAIMSDMQGG